MLNVEELTLGFEARTEFHEPPSPHAFGLIVNESIVVADAKVT
jgi:hypothetical protein